MVDAPRTFKKDIAKVGKGIQDKYGFARDKVKYAVKNPWNTAVTGTNAAGRGIKAGAGKIFTRNKESPDTTATRAGGYGAGSRLRNWLGSYNSATGELKFGGKWVVACIIIFIVGWVLAGIRIGAFIAVLVFVGRLYYVWSRKTENRKRLFWIVLLILIGLAVYVFGPAVMSAGATQELQSHMSTFIGTQEARAQYTPWQYFKQCYFQSTEGCEIATIKGDGGIYITRTTPDADEYEEKVEPVYVEGFISGKTWLGGKRGTGPEISDISTKVTAEWVDPALKLKYPNGWSCEPAIMRGANDEFMCKHEERIDIDEFKGSGTKVCGANLAYTKSGSSAALYCSMSTATEYEFSTDGFRILRFAEDTSQTSLDAVGKGEVMWSAGAPVIISIGDNIDWNKPLKVYYDSPRNVRVKLSNNIPEGFSSVYKGLSAKDMEANLHKLTLEVPVKTGMNVNCNDGILKTTQSNYICEYDLKGEKIEANKFVDRTLSITFDKSYTPVQFEDITIVGTVDYTAITHRAQIVRLRYRYEPIATDKVVVYK